jgi:hypothetical protein
MKQRVVHILLTIVVFTYIVFEELVWETIARPIYEYIHSLRVLQKLELHIRRMHPWLLLGIFLLIFALVEGIGLLAGVFLLQGNVIFATLMYITKIPVAAFAFWLFRISQEKLLSIRWFSYAYGLVMEQIEKIKASDVYRTIKAKTTQIKARIKIWKNTYFPRGEMKKRIKRIYVELKKIFKKERL